MSSSSDEGLLAAVFGLGPLERFIAETWRRDVSKHTAPGGLAAMPLSAESLLDLVAAHLEVLVQRSWLKLFAGTQLSGPPVGGGAGVGPRDHLVRWMSAQEVTTVKVQHIETLHEGIAELALALARVFRQPVGVNANLILRPSETSFREAKRDLLVFPCQGQLAWEVAGGASSLDTTTFQLGPGDSLYLPRARMRCMIPDPRGPCLYLTFAFECSDGRVLLRWLRETIENQPDFERDLRGGPPGSGIGAARFGELARLIIGKLRAPSTWEEFCRAIEERHARSPLQSLLGPPFEVHPSRRVQLGKDEKPGARASRGTVEMIVEGGFLPVRIATTDAGLQVVWTDFGSRRLTEPFFRQSARLVGAGGPLLAAPEIATDLEVIHEVARAAAKQLVPPAGFVFHVSRTGSTLVSRLLASAPRALVVSEAPALNQLLSLSEQQILPGTRELLAGNLLRILGRRRWPECDRYVIKFTSWNLGWFSTIQQLFPQVPAVILFRNPAAVLASVVARPPAWLRGAEDRLIAARLARLYQGAWLASANAGLFDYDQLPGAIWNSIAPRFGLPVDHEWRAQLEELAGFDAKDPQLQRRFISRAVPPRAASVDGAERLEVLYQKLRSAAGAAQAGPSLPQGSQLVGLS